MSRVKALQYEEAPAEAQAVYGEIEGAFGMVPDLFKVTANFAPLLIANWEKVKAVMMTGVLSRKAKETIAVLVSKDNSCSYCIAAHTGALKSIGITDEELKQIEEDVNKADFTPKELALIGLARRANSDPAKITDEEFAALTDKGVTGA